MSDWKKTTVGMVSTGFLSGGTPTTSRADYWQGEIPWITSKWLGDKLELTSGEKLVSKEAIKHSATKIVPKDSIIFATRVGVGKVGINRINLAINQDLAGILIDNENYDIKFLAYQLGLDSIQQYVAMNKRGATIKGITRDCLEQIRLNIPPLPEQKKIAHILSTVQRAIEAQERIIQTTTELKKALMHKLFTEGLLNEPQKQTEIGLVPESWELFSIGDLFETQLGKMLSQKAKVGDSPKIYLRNKNVQWG
jgi:type I restriction enzyme S subunit